MSDWFFLFGMLIVGIGLGFFYFGGLWFTVRRLSHSRHPALLSFLSFIVRSVVVIAIFYFTMDGHLMRLAVAMVGFIVARQILFRYLAAQPNLYEATKGKVN